MKIRELLKEFMFVKDIKARINNNTIKINGSVVTVDMLDKDIDILSGYWEYHDFTYRSFYYKRNIKKSENLVLNCFDIKDFFGDDVDTNIDFLKWLRGFLLLTISKKESYVFMYSQN